MDSRPEALALRRVTAFSRGIFRIPHLGVLLGAEQFVPRAEARSNPRGLDAVVGWGFKATATRARAFAARHGVRYVALEDGFLRSAGNAPTKLPPISIILDDLGIYYEARQPSRLEALIATAASDPGFVETGRLARRHMLSLGLTKYNPVGAGDPAAVLGRPRRVLIVDQTFNDQSVSGGGAAAATFSRMLATALERHAADDIVVKAHPDVVAGRARGYLDQEAQAHGVTVVTDPIGPFELMPWFEEVWTVSSGFGFEALMAERTVRCFGAPFYAGWGLTDDSMVEPRAAAWLKRRTARVGVDELAAAALIGYPRYADPVRGERIHALSAMDRLAEWRAGYASERRSFVGYGLSRAKRQIARSMFSAGPGRLLFPATDIALETAVGSGAGLLVWSDRIDARVEDDARRRGLSVIRLAPGAIDASAVATEQVPMPCLVVDEVGVDFDATRPSGLEELLNGHPLDPLARARGAALRERLVALDERMFEDAAALRDDVRARAGGRRVVLVVGEALNTAESRLGSAGIASNAALAKAVRRSSPDAFVAFLEPAALQARRQAGWVPHAALAPHVDMVVRDDDMAALFAIADEVHVNTSRLGFAAILHGARVVCWGMPNYAGWGVTEDRAPIARRVRRLDRDELVAGLLVLYPRYVDPVSRIPCTAEELVARLEALPGRRARVPTSGGRSLRNRLIRLEATLRHVLFGWRADAR